MSSSWILSFRLIQLHGRCYMLKMSISFMADLHAVMMSFGKTEEITCFLPAGPLDAWGEIYHQWAPPPRPPNDEAV